jgi:hypothetical protein
MDLTELFRLLVIVFLGMHGIGHVIWFLAAWTPVRAGVADGAWSLPGQVTIRSPIGRIWGLVAIAATVVFLAASAALLGEMPSWRGLTFFGIVLSLVAVAPWRRQSPGSTWLMAIVADLVLLFLLALPLSVDLLPLAEGHLIGNPLPSSW